MKLTITAWSFTELTLREAWGVTQAIGLGAMDLGLLHRPALDRAAILADPQAAAAKVRDIGISVSNLYWLFGASPFDRAVSDPAALDENLADFRKVVAFAAAIGAPSIFVLPGVAHAGTRLSDAFAASVRALAALKPVADEAGVLLTVEPHVGGLIACPEMAEQLVDAVPGLKLTLDYAHFVAMGYPQAEIDRLAPHAGHVHLRQARPGALQAKLGEGTLDFVAMIETLRAAGYDGYLALEYVHQAYMNTLSDDVLTETVSLKRLIEPAL
ncbi:sugar phosphate isomerase/epimerase family protein [Acuticoccus sp. MNP-M23]|uniref:sugar phosphate isomerase/epimerase family protein n=1 Tax=Acuticoccus sp. MNP-M23 TaxID=3072793 RepID=UPI00281595AF|nr:sugar phosphate isomerase/epimerase family protein [Acuticoccus sp. MNP-M23]WMS43584.1 sugar phosphate isomerase/epimerase family protein [Acuticoccus sp. MNP-M23]